MMQQPLNTNQVQVVVMTQPGIIDKQSKYKNMKIVFARQLIGLGVVQILIGILCIIFQGISVYIHTSGVVVNIDYIGHGFWSGLMFLITGPFGIAGGNKRCRCLVIAFNVLSILSACSAASLICIAIPSALFYAIGSEDYCSSYDHNFCISIQERETGTAMQAMSAILGLIGGIIAIRSSVVCCSIGACCCNCGASCCCPPDPLQNQFLMTGLPFAGQQQIVIAPQQQSDLNQQPQIVISNQQPMFLANLQQLMFPPNPHQPIVGLEPRQQMIQYNPQQSNLPHYSEQLNAYASLSPAPKDHGSYTGLHTEITNARVVPEQPAIPSVTISTSTYDEIYEYDAIEIGLD